MVTRNDTINTRTAVVPVENTSCKTLTSRTRSCEVLRTTACCTAAVRHPVLQKQSCIRAHRGLHPLSLYIDSSTAYFANQAAASLALAAKMAGSFPRNFYSSCIPTSRTGGRTRGTRHPRLFPLPPFPTSHRPRGVISTGWSPHCCTASHKSTHNDDHDEDDFDDTQDVTAIHASQKHSNVCSLYL